MRQIGDVAALCREQLLTEKIIITPTAGGGRQWCERIAREGTPWLQLHAMSVDALATHVLTNTQRMPHARLTRGQSLRLLAEVCAQLLPESALYAPLRANTGFHRALLTAIEDCLLAGIDPAKLEENHFQHPQRAEEFRLLSGAFLAACRSQERSLRADLLTAACAACETFDRSGRIILIDEAFERALTPLERRFLETAGTCMLLAPADTGKRELHFRRALREEWEIRAAFRAVTTAGRTWDAAEIILARRDLLPIVYELSRQLEIPCTFDPGAPLHYSKAARTVTAYLRWISTDFEATHLIRMMYDGVPDFSEWKDDGIRGGRLSCAALLREAGIGHGRERYLDRIDARIIAVEHAVAKGHAESKQIHEYRADRAWIARLLEVTPLPDADGKLSLHASADAVRVLVTEMSRDKFPGEQEALERLALLLGEYRDGTDLQRTPADLAELMIRDIRSTTFPLVLQQPGAEPLRVTSPQPGHLHISTLDRGGWSGRPCTLVLGVDAATLPRQGSQNPVLLDSERRSINEKEQCALPLAEDAASRSAHTFECLLRRLPGSVTLSWSEADAQDGGARFPSRLLLDALRRERDNETLQIDDLLESCGDPLGPAPDAAPTTMAEWWLQQHLRTTRAAFTQAMRQAHPLLERGAEAVVARKGSRFTVFDGHVPPDTYASPLGKPLSASRLEGLAACPYRFFLSTVLQLFPPEPWEHDQDRWLDAAQRGQAVHAILHRFMEILREKNDLPVREHHRSLLDRICRETLEAYAEEIPVPSDLLRSEEERAIRAMLQIFFREEMTSERVPIALERVFGHRRGDGAPLPALELELPGGMMQVSGTIDRVDREEDNSIVVVDYKTGADKVDPQNALAGGRTLQHALYAEAVRRNLLSDEHASTSIRSEYMYLSAREQGRRMRMPDTRTELPAILELLRSLIAEGVFPHTTDKKECRYCDFAELCGDAGTMSVQSARKVDAGENVMLESFRRMQHG